MIFTVPSNAQPSCFDSGEAQPDGLSKGGSVDMWDTVLVTDSPV